MTTIISGSARPGSNTLRVAKAIKRLLEAKGVQEVLIRGKDFSVEDKLDQSLGPVCRLLQRGVFLRRGSCHMC